MNSNPLMEKTSGIKLEVPYYSQFLDVEDKYWMPRACGMACAKMVLDFYKVDTASLDELIKKGSEEGGYGPWGWVHDYFVAFAKGYGLEAHREEKMDPEKGMAAIIDALRRNHPVIVSATKHILGQTKFHMVVITGYEEDKSAVTGLYYHDPESTTREGGQHLFVDKETFMHEWRKMAIFIHPENV